MTIVGRSAPRRHRPAQGALYLGLFGHFQSSIDFDAEVTNGTFELGMSWQQLHGSQVLGPAIDQGRLRPPKFVCAVASLVQIQLSDPGVHDPGVLPRREVV